jgi:MoxR-like ATPase
LDRFLLYVKVNYPSGPEEWEIARRITTGKQGKIEATLSADEIVSLQQLVVRVPVSDQVLGYAWALVRGTRPGTPEAHEFVDKWISWGAGPRGVLTLITCAKARAILHGRYHATVGDVQAIVKPALRHRIAGNYAAQAHNLTSDKLIDMLLEATPADRVYQRPAA